MVPAADDGRYADTSGQKRQGLRGGEIASAEYGPLLIQRDASGLPGRCLPMATGMLLLPGLIQKARWNGQKPTAEQTVSSSIKGTG